MELPTLVLDFACALKLADSKGPQACSFRSGRKYQPGIRPHSEDVAVDLVLAELRSNHPERYNTLRVRVPYPNSRQKCDLVWGHGSQWAIEVKMARFSGDNGKPDDTSIKDILSPYDQDRSAISDCVKLTQSPLGDHKAVLIYGFDDKRRPLKTMVDAFEILANSRVRLGLRIEQRFDSFIHPVFSSGIVFAWEIFAK
jgi:hypothetical protein